MEQSTREMNNLLHRMEGLESKDGAGGLFDHRLSSLPGQTGSPLKAQSNPHTYESHHGGIVCVVHA